MAPFTVRDTNESSPRAASPQRGLRSSTESDDLELSTRPRLTQEQASLLEKYFQMHHKPSTDIKKQLAEATSLSLPRVANWFQNRRAKAKQQKKFELMESHNKLKTVGHDIQAEPMSPDLIIPSSFFVTDFDPAPQTSQESQSPYTTHAEQESAGYISMPFDVATDAGDSDVVQTWVETTTEGAMDEGAMCDIGYQDSFQCHITAPPHLLEESRAADSAEVSHASLPPSTFSAWDSDKGSSSNWPPAQHFDGHFEGHNDQQQHSQALISDGLSHDSRSPSLLDGIVSESPQSISTRLGSAGQDVPVQGSLGLESQSPNPPDDSTRHESCPAGFANELQARNIHALGSGPSANSIEDTLNIAARRRRPRPAALANTALRSQSLVGPFQVSPRGKGALLGPASPVRRIRSTGNNIDLLRGRIQKSIPGSAQRSPLSFATFAEAGAFANAPSTGCPSFVTSTSQALATSAGLAPPTPLSPLNVAATMFEQPNLFPAVSVEQPGLFESVALEPQNLPLNIEYPGYFVPPAINMHSNLVSPPSTPHDAAAFNLYHQSMGLVETSPSLSVDHFGYHHDMSEEPMVSPFFASFPPQIHMPQPVYASRINYSDSEMAGLLDLEDGNQEKASQKAEKPPASPDKMTELTFHNTTPPELPGGPAGQKGPQPKRNFVFSNVTPDDF
ncbi:MAG: hypothetical protein M1825_003101 [Sarcosagium campestre]|nr:MAG: hypothetical protein M1825_003101 [Sarcosagium campestre]